MERERRPVDEISGEEWWRWRWVDVTRLDDSERMFARGFALTPAEAAEAKAQIDAIGWDAYRERLR